MRGAAARPLRRARHRRTSASPASRKSRRATAAGSTAASSCSSPSVLTTSRATTRSGSASRWSALARDGQLSAYTHARLLAADGHAARQDAARSLEELLAGRGQRAPWKASWDAERRCSAAPTPDAACSSPATPASRARGWRCGCRRSAPRSAAWRCRPGHRPDRTGSLLGAGDSHDARVDLRDAAAVRDALARFRPRNRLPPGGAAAGAAQLSRAGRDLRQQRHRPRAPARSRARTAPRCASWSTRPPTRCYREPRCRAAATARTTRSAATIPTAPPRPAPNGLGQLPQQLSSAATTAAASRAAGDGARRQRHRRRRLGARTGWCPTWCARARAGAAAAHPQSAGDPALAARAGAAVRLPAPRPASAGRRRAAAEAWNFGPDAEAHAQRRRVVARFCSAHWPQLRGRTDRGPHPHEAADPAPGLPQGARATRLAPGVERRHHAAAHRAVVPRFARARRGAQPRRPRRLRRRRPRAGRWAGHGRASA